MTLKVPGTLRVFFAVVTISFLLHLVTLHIDSHLHQSPSLLRNYTVLFLERPLLQSHLPSRTSAVNGSFTSQTLSHKIHYVHVGKAGGMTVRYHLRSTCFVRPKLQACLAMMEERFAQNPSGESAISQQVVWYSHCDHSPPKPSYQKSTSFLFSVRDPVDRVISWFLYYHPKNCGKYWTSCREDEPWRMRFFGCFDQMDDWARELTLQQHPDKTCTQMAMDAAKGYGKLPDANHMTYNYQYYTNRTMRAYPEKEVFVIRTEFFWNDFNKVDLLLGGRGGGYLGENVTHQHRDLIVFNRTVGEVGMRGLCCALVDEIRTYHEILDRALNIEDHEGAHEKRCARYYASGACQAIP